MFEALETYCLNKIYSQRLSVVAPDLKRRTRLSLSMAPWTTGCDGGSGRTRNRPYQIQLVTSEANELRISRLIPKGE